MLSKEEKQKIKDLKKQMAIEKALKKKRLLDVVSDVELLQAIIKKACDNPNLKVEIVTSDGTVIRLKNEVDSNRGTVVFNGEN